MSYHGDLAMILTNVPFIMICHNIDMGTMVNHDLARLTMITSSAPWLRTLGYGVVTSDFKLYFTFSLSN